MQSWIETKSDHEIYFTTESGLAYDAVQTKIQNCTCRNWNCYHEGIRGFQIGDYAILCSTNEVANKIARRLHNNGIKPREGSFDPFN